MKILDPENGCPRCGGTFDAHQDGGVVCLSCGARYSVYFEDEEGEI